MPLSILESFAAGRPVIATDVGCCKELISKVREDDSFGPAGFCVTPMDIKAMTDAMTEMCLEPEKRYRMGQAGKKRVEKYFLHEDMIMHYQAVYDRVLEKATE